MRATDDSWRVWRWTVVAGLVALAIVCSYRIASEALGIASRFVTIYERTHQGRSQRTVTDWPEGESRQTVSTDRDSDEQLKAWLDRHDNGVIGAAETARRRAIAPQIAERR